MALTSLFIRDQGEAMCTHAQTRCFCQDSFRRRLLVLMMGLLVRKINILIALDMKSWNLSWKDPTEVFSKHNSDTCPMAFFQS